ncbi:MAG: 6-bladed beta-propeller [Candidatus Aminicenantales bacterium]
MKKSKQTALAIVILLILPKLISCKKQKTVWAGTIKEVNGVTVVQNPKTPIFGKDACAVEEDLSIGSPERGGDFAFSQIIDVGIDAQENIYILDFKEAHIMVFNKAGGYLGTIGRKGQGPGEMQGPMNIFITPRDEILVNDRGNRLLHFFGRDGQYLRSISLGRMQSFSRPEVDSQDNVVGRPVIFLPSRVVYVLAKFDSGLKELFRVFSYEYDIVPNIRNMLPPECFWAVGINDNIIWGYSDKYELHLLDKSGHSLRHIIKDYEPVKITEEEKKEWASSVYGDKGVPSDIKVNWKNNHNAFHSLDVDDSGRIFVQTYEKAAEGHGYYYDVFDPEGKYIARILLKAAPRVLKKGKLYTIEEDEKGFQVVKRYKVSWKS